MARGRLAAVYALETLEADAAAAGDASTRALADDNAFVRYDNNSLSRGHVLVVPRRRSNLSFPILCLSLPVTAR